MIWKWRPIEKGEPYWEPVEGGSIQRESPCDGICIDGVGVIPLAELEAALVKLGLPRAET